MSEATTIGEFIRERRTKRRMTLRALARAIGVSAPFMCDVEKNRRSLTDERLAAVAKVLHCRRSDLVKRNGLRRELVEWIRSNPGLAKLLNDMKEQGRPVVIGGDRCPCCWRPHNEADATRLLARTGGDET